MKDFLFELGTEELPPKALKSFIKSITESVDKGRAAAGLTRGDILSFGAPRRLAILIKELQDTGATTHTETLGPPLKIAFDVNGSPTPAALAFAKKNNVSINEIQKSDTHLFYKGSSPGVKAVDILPGIVQKALIDLPIPKRMRWGSGKAEFVRPVHWLVMLYGKDVIPCEILGKKADRITHGHRFHAPGDLAIDEPASYQSLLRNHYVEVCFKMRRDKIVAQVNSVADKLGGKAVIDRDLLDEVTALVEWPVALAGNFEKRFLDVPQEALISSMSEHQKYFHVIDGNDKLMPHFITVANLESKDPKQVIDGNERVIRPRLSDAAFFFATDKKQTLESRLEKLKAVTFQEKLGSVYDKSLNVSLLAEKIANAIAADPVAAARAGLLCKADLVTKMVLEFDQMQGIAGQYYALNDKESSVVANAIREHYLPKFAGDEVPQSLEGCAVALADRLDTLVGIFSIGEKPTGSKDPFALRRAAIGVLNIILKKQLEIDLAVYVKNDFALSYIIDRFQSMYEEEGITIEVFKSVAESKNRITTPADFDKRVRAVNEFNKLPEAQSLAAANKRVTQIFVKSGLIQTVAANPELFQQDEERILADLINKKQAFIAQFLKQRKYTEALCSLADLRAPVDAFFDKVMVNAEDKDIRNNRFALLLNLQSLFLSIADISHLVPEKK